MAEFPLQALIRAANQAKTEGAAVVAANSALAEAVKARMVADRELPSGLRARIEPTYSAAATVKRLDNAVQALTSTAKSYRGRTPARGVTAAYTAQGGLRDQVVGVYSIIWDIYDRASRPPSEFQASVAELAHNIEKYASTIEGKGLLAAAGTIIGDVATQAGKGVGAVGSGLGAGLGEAGKGVSSGLGDVLAGTWKPLLVIGIVALAVGGVYVFTLSKVKP